MAKRKASNGGVNKSALIREVLAKSPKATVKEVVAACQEQGCRPIYFDYPMGHEINAALIAELSIWITKTLSPRLRGSL
jgi:hypothetical protein